MNFDHAHSRDHNAPQEEQQLIAFHLGEPCDTQAILARLDADPAFAALSQDIAQTLRIFSAEPVSPPDTEAAWHRLQPTLPMYEAPIVPWRRWTFFAPRAAVAALLLVVCLVLWHHNGGQKIDEAGVIPLRPSAGSPEEQGMSQHLDRAERWLTVVNHTASPLDGITRSEGQQLLTRNAVYLQDARNRGELADAAVLDRLGRVLTTANHPEEGGIHLRVEMNTEGLLFDLRILRQNQAQLSGDSR